MAVSGSQKTRIGASISGVGSALTITAKSETTIVPPKYRGMLASQSIRRSMRRGRR